MAVNPEKSKSNIIESAISSALKYSEVLESIADEEIP